MRGGAALPRVTWPRVTWPARRAARAATARCFSASATGARDVRRLWSGVVASRASGRRRYATYYPFARLRLPHQSAITTTRGPFCPRSLLSSSPRSSSISRRHGLRARLRDGRTPASVSWVGIFFSPCFFDAGGSERSEFSLMLPNLNYECLRMFGRRENCRSRPGILE